MPKFLNMLKKDENTMSVGRFTAVVAVVLWVLLSTYLALRNLSWGCYEAFCLTTVAFVLAQLGNKAIDCKLFKVTETK